MKTKHVTVDAGYRQTKVVVGMDATSVHQHPSLMSIEPGEYTPFGMSLSGRKTNGVILSYISGQSPWHQGKFFTIGEGARNHRSRQDAFKLEKENWGLLNTLAAVNPEVDGVDVHLSVDILHQSPSPAVVQRYESVFLGEHCIKIGKTPVTVTIDEINVFLEPMGSYYWALANGVLEDQEGKVNYVIDVGGSTMTALAVEYGEPIPNSQHTLTQGGTIRLAELIASHPTFKRKFDETRGQHGHSTPDISYIMDGLAASGNAQYRYGNAFSFFGDNGDNIAYAQEQWRAGIMAEIKDRLKPWLPSFNQTLITGGSAQFLYHAMKGNERNAKLLPSLCPDFGTSNVRGFAHQVALIKGQNSVTSIRKVS